MATMKPSENAPALQYEHVCDLCWERFETAEELAAHIEQEQWTIYEVGRA